MDIDSEAELEIDPTLFIKCRLCVKETGVFQILPSVRDQIKDCFDIIVKQYDNLPKLICKKCKGILNEYSLIKRQFLDNQILLQNNTSQRQPVSIFVTKAKTDYSVTCLEKHNAAPSSTANASHVEETNHNIKSKNKKRTKRKRIACITSSSDSDDTTLKSIKTNSPSVSPEDLLMKTHEKSYVCRYCKIKYKSLSQIVRHTKVHTKLRSKFKTTVKQHCTVLLDKIDDKSNALAKDTAIALRSNLLIDNVGSSDYFVAYTPKIELKHPDSNVDTDRSSSFDHIKSKSKKAKRISSRSSSNDTVVIEGSNKDLNNTQSVNESTCINIEDESSSDYLDHELTLGEKDVRAIKKLIAVCMKNTTNIDSLGMTTSKHLNRKLLSVGRKILTKNQNQQPGLPGLIKYLEHKDLPIKFHPIYKQDDYVTINTKLYQNNDFNSKLSKWGILKRTKPIEQPIPCMKSFLSKFNVELEPQKDGSISEGFLKKLLNSNPVANPKKLPKKISPQDAILYENPNELVAHVEEKNEPDSSNLILIDSDDDADNCVQMPVIMSTESLAPKKEINETEHKQEKENKPTEETNQDNQAENHVPRIKCKPVSELMGSNALPSNNNGCVVPVEGTLPKVVYCQTNGTDRPNTLVDSQKVAPVANNQQNTITLDSALLPHMSTASPVQYFNNLLQLHGLLLMNDAKFSVPKDFVCLVKYKLDITTKHKKNALLSIAFYGLKNRFCLRMSRGNQKDVDLQVLSPFWQMEVFKSFNGEVSDKILNCSLKHSPELYQNAKQFLFLLKNINNKTAR